MKKYISFFLLVVTAALTLTSCDDNTDAIGTSIVPDKDIITASKKEFYATSKSLDAGNSILNTSERLYLGRYTEPETSTTFTAGFATQFASGEGEIFPKEGVIDNTSFFTKLRIYYDDFIGDENNAMKCEVYELDNVMEEGKDYYTDFDITEYYDPSKAPLAAKVFSAKDYAKPDSLSEDEYATNIEINLPNEIGARIVSQYYSTPSDFANSEIFINNVFKGVYVKCTQGDGTVINAYRTRLEVAFQHYITSSTGEKDSIETLVSPFYSGKEVLQLNTFDNGDISELVNNTNHTYLKTPAGIFTEVELPIDQIMEECAGDTLNSVKIEFGCQKTSDNKDFAPATELLMVRKKDMYTFFEKNKVCDNKTSFYTTMADNTKRYIFSNIAELVKYCYREYENGEADADWKKVVLIPIETTTDSYGNVIKVAHYTKMSHVKLNGGSDYKIRIEVISSKFNN